MKFIYNEQINDIIGIPEKKDKTTLKNIIYNYIKSYHGDELKSKNLINSFNKKLQFTTHTCLLNAEEVFNSIANNLTFIKVIFIPENYFEFNEWKKMIRKIQENSKR